MSIKDDIDAEMDAILRGRQVNEVEEAQRRELRRLMDQNAEAALRAQYPLFSRGRRTGHALRQEEFNGRRMEQLEGELQRLLLEGNPHNEDLVRDIENLMNMIGARPMSYVKNERLEALEKILLKLIDHLDLKVEMNIKHREDCHDRTCTDPTCGKDKEFSIVQKPKEYNKAVDKLDDLIITGEDEE